MILRAIFWISVVAVFIPREPDLGYGPPGGFLPPGTAAAKSALACEDPESPCPGALVLAEDLRNTVLSNLDRVKAELNEQSEKADQRRSLTAYLPKF
jgi:hypothetical protein